MIHKKAASPIIATIILLVVGAVLGSAVWMWNIAGSSEEPSVYRFELVSARLVKPVTVSNAGWQIELIVANRGNIDDVLDKVYINRVLVTETGLSSGDSLSSKSSIGTDIPSNGLSVPSGKTSIVFVWVGSDLLSTGTTITVEIQRQNQYDTIKYLTLN